MEVSVKANREIAEELKGDGAMHQALLKSMEPEIAQIVRQATEKEGREKEEERGETREGKRETREGKRETREGRGCQAVERGSREICDKNGKAAKIYNRRDTGVLSRTFH